MTDNKSFTTFTLIYWLIIFRFTINIQAAKYDFIQDLQINQRSTDGYVMCGKSGGGICYFNEVLCSKSSVVEG